MNLKNLFEFLKILIIHPVKFFTDIAPRQTFRQAFVFDVIQTYVAFLPVILLYSFMFSFLIIKLTDIPLYAIISSAALGIPLLFIIYTFVISFFSFLILKIAGGKGDYVSTYKASVYAGFPGAVGMFFFIIGGSIVSLYGLGLQVIGYAKAHKVSYLRGAIPLIVYVMLFMVALLVTAGLFFSFVVPDLEKETSAYGNFERSLNVSEVVFGEDFGGPCLPKKEVVFTTRDKACLYFLNVTSFEKGEDGLHWFDIATKIVDSQEEVIGYKKNLYKEDGHQVLRDDTLDHKGVILTLEDYEPGAYTIEVTLYDKIGKKQTSVNRTFTVEEKIFDPELVVGSSILGAYTSSDCYPLERDFSTTDKICLQPVNVTGFKEREDGRNWFEMDYKIVDSSGTVMSQNNNVFGEKGNTFLRDDTLTDDFIFVSLEAFPLGNYTIEMMIYDRLSKKRASLNRTFTVGSQDLQKEPERITRFLTKNKSGTYTLNNVDYEVELLGLTKNPNRATFQVNGQITNSLRVNEKFELAFGKISVNSFEDDGVWFTLTGGNPELIPDFLER